MSVVISNAGGNWSSGGSWQGLIAPTAADDATATGTSGNLTVDAANVCRSLDFTNYVGLFTFTSGRGISLSIGDGTAGAGNVALRFVSGMTKNFSGAGISLISTSGTQQSVFSGGLTTYSLSFSGAGGSWILGDNHSLNNLTLTAGTLDTNGKSVTLTGGVTVTGSTTRTLTLGASVITIAGTAPWDATTTTNLTFSGASSTILLSYVGASAYSFIGGGLTYGTVQVAMTGSGVLTFTGSNTFSVIQRSGTGTKTIKFTDGTTTTLTGGTSAFFSGTSGNLITITGTSTGGWTLNLNGNTVSCDYISLDYCTVTNGTLYAGSHSTNGGHNGANVIFTGPPSAITDYRYYSTGRRRRCTYA
jgi:hypothetical protein